MPTYEYECSKCGDRFDVFQRMSEDALESCEHCGGHLKKVFHPVGIVFKGSGFYCTDSRKPSCTTKCSTDLAKKCDGAESCEKAAVCEDVKKDVSAVVAKETAPAAPTD